MNEELQGKVCHLLMVSTGMLLGFSKAMAITFAAELTVEEMDIVMAMADKYEKEVEE